MSPDDLTDEDIARMIEVPKRITHRPKKPKDKPGHDEWEWSVDSVDGKFAFTAYARQSLAVSASFSCGLRWRMPSGEEVTLVRCNGSSHVHRNQLERTGFQFVTHKHIATERYIRAGLPPDRYAEPLGGYDNLAGALRVLADVCRIGDAMLLPVRVREPSGTDPDHEQLKMDLET